MFPSYTSLCFIFLLIHVLSMPRSSFYYDGLYFVVFTICAYSLCRFYLLLYVVFYHQPSVLVYVIYMLLKLRTFFHYMQYHEITISCTTLGHWVEVRIISFLFRYLYSRPSFRVYFPPHAICLLH